MAAGRRRYPGPSSGWGRKERGWWGGTSLQQEEERGTRVIQAEALWLEVAEEGWWDSQ